MEAVHYVMMQLAHHLNYAELDSLLARAASLPPQEVDGKVVRLVTELLATAVQDPEYIKARERHVASPSFYLCDFTLPCQFVLLTFSHLFSDSMVNGTACGFYGNSHLGMHLALRHPLPSLPLLRSLILPLSLPWRRPRTCAPKHSRNCWKHCNTRGASRNGAT